MPFGRWVFLLCLAVGLLLAGSPAAGQGADEGLWFSQGEAVWLLQAVRDRQHLEEIVKLQAGKIEALERIVEAQERLLKAKDALVESFRERDALQARLLDNAADRERVLTEQVAAERRAARSGSIKGFLTGGGVGFGAGALTILLLLVLL